MPFITRSGIREASILDGGNGMATKMRSGGRGLGAWRVPVWGIPIALLLLPAVAMRFTDEVKWDLADFVIIGILLFSCSAMFELAARIGHGIFYRAGAGLTIVTMFLLIWVNMAVGIIGDEGDPANLMYAGVIFILFGGAIVAHFSAEGMTRALLATGTAQAAVTLVALAAGMGADDPPGPLGVLILNGIFTGLWLLAALLFRQAAKPIAG
jgi:hypothetical protein